MVAGNKILNLSPDPSLDKIFCALGKDKNLVRFIGGYVRDLLLDKASDDIDIATSIHPNIVIDKLNLAGIKTIPTGIKFGTITAYLDSSKYEITTLRKDIRCNGRHADVSFTDSWEIDAMRRDFTINALSCSFDGEVFDYFNGIDDLEKNIVKFIGAPTERIKEDYLRILRFFRFSQNYAKECNTETLEVIKKYSYLLENLSGERIQNEFLKILKGNQLAKILDLIDTTNVAKYIEIKELNLSRKLENLLSAEQYLSFSAQILARLYLATESNLDQIIKRWCLANNVSQELRFLLNYDKKINNQKLKKLQDILIEVGHERFKNLLLIEFSKNIRNSDFYLEVYNSFKNFSIPSFPLTGKDIVKLDISPGPQISKLLNLAKEYWIDDNYQSDKNTLISYLKQNM